MDISFIIKRKNRNVAFGILVWPAMGLESDAVSGPYGKGELPNGLYDIPRNGLMNKSGKPGFCDRNGNCWFQYLDPKFSTDRAELGIHPDGNKPGTLGCIGLKDDDTSSWFKAFKSLPKNYVITLEVIEEFS